MYNSIFGGTTMVQKFNLQAPYTPQGDQPDAIAKLLEGLEEGEKHQTLLGATGTRKNIYSFKCCYRNK